MPYKDPVEARAAQKRSYEAHREERAASRKRYYESHREQTAVAVKKYVNAHREEYNAYHRLYRKTQPGQVASEKRYREANREKRNVHRSTHRRLRPDLRQAAELRRRARKCGASVSTFTAKEWAEMKLAYADRCVYCLEKTKMTQDHVVPLVKGGQHCASNIVPACLPCNMKKGTKLLVLAMRETV